MTSLKKNAVLSPDQTVLNLTAMGSASHQETTSASCTTQIRAFSMKPVIYWAEKNLLPPHHYYYFRLMELRKALIAM